MSEESDFLISVTGTEPIDIEFADTVNCSVIVVAYQGLASQWGNSLRDPSGAVGVITLRQPFTSTSGWTERLAEVSVLIDGPDNDELLQ